MPDYALNYVHFVLIFLWSIGIYEFAKWKTKNEIKKSLAAGIVPEDIDKNSAGQEFKAEIAIVYEKGKLVRAILVKGTTRKIK